jgi:hypothetical protein
VTIVEEHVSQVRRLRFLPLALAIELRIFLANDRVLFNSEPRAESPEP